MRPAGVRGYLAVSASSGGAERTTEATVILATTQVEDVDRFLEVFSIDRPTEPTCLPTN